jgi:tetratricopeptide (TPR) repeat protein/ferredoxin
MVQAAQPPKATREQTEAPAHGCGARRPSRRGRWRALSLILVHVLAAVHIAHWLVTGTTLTPVEPSEAMQTLGQSGLVNAGFVLFALLIVSTFLFGRFFCGWGCHIVALQDLCTWMMSKAGIRPKPFRSRLLVFVPLLAFVYMFVLPSLVRLWTGAPSEELKAHFLTDDFWGRFPAWPIALLTFAVCGFVIVYLLGNKGFCTYACPYGGIFGVADQVAPGRILVTDACEGCGHCTATCTSNVRVHEEVRTWGMVVDPGCMKCMDCVSVCPKDALHFGFGRPALFKGKPRKELAPRRFDFSWREEIVLGAVFAASIVVLRGLYDRVPFLLALGAAAISAAGVVTLFRLFYVKKLKLGRFQLSGAEGITRSGRVLVALSAVWIVFLVHSGVVKGYAFQGQRTVAAADATSSELRAAVEMLQRSQSLALVSMGRLEEAMANGLERVGDLDGAVLHYRRLMELEPDYGQGRMRLAGLLAQRGERDAAVDVLREALRRQPDLPGAPGALAEQLVALDRAQEAADELKALLDQRPGDEDVRVSYGVVLAHAGDLEACEVEIRGVIERDPEHLDAHVKLAQIFGFQQRQGEALALYERAATIDPKNVEWRYAAAQAAMVLRRSDDARRHLGVARELAPFNPGIVETWAAVVRGTGALDAEIAAAQAAAGTDRALRFALMYLYRAAGRTEEADRLGTEFRGIATER